MQSTSATTCDSVSGEGSRVPDEADRIGARAAEWLRAARPAMREVLQERRRALGLETNFVDLFDLARRLGDRRPDRDLRASRQAVDTDLDCGDLIAIDDIAMRESDRAPDA
jgi:hypothetical protein